MIIIFLLCAFRSGADRYYLKKSQGFSVKGREILYYLKPKNGLFLAAFYLNYWSRKLLLVLLCFAPFVTVAGYLVLYLRQGSASVNVSTVIFFAAIVFAVNGGYFFIRLNSFLFLARYYFASGKYSNFRQLFEFSYTCIEGKRGEVLKKRLSFIGWFLSCIFIFPTAFVRSYYRESMANLAGDLIEH